MFLRNQRHIFFLSLFLLPYSLIFGQTRFDHSPLLDQSKVSYIKDTVDLSGRIVQLPENKKLVFDGGVLTNGIVVGHQNSIEAGEETCIFGNGCMVKGTWSTPARPEWFGAKADGIAYYNRPLCCYNGDVDSVKVSDQYVNVNISHPSSHIESTMFIIVDGPTPTSGMTARLAKHRSAQCSPISRQGKLSFSMERRWSILIPP